MAGFMIGETLAPPALTPARLEWLKLALTKYGVSDVGAEQFVRWQAVTDVSDRRQLLDTLNRVVVQESRRGPVRSKNYR